MKMKKKHFRVETENLIWKRTVRQALEGCSFITAKESFTEKEIFQGYVACGYWWRGESFRWQEDYVANLKFKWVCVKNATAYSTIRRKSMAGKEERCCFLMMQISHGQTLNFNHNEMRNHWTLLSWICYIKNSLWEDIVGYCNNPRNGGFWLGAKGKKAA